MGEEPRNVFELNARLEAQLTATQENYDAIKSHNKTLYVENGRLSAQLAAARAGLERTITHPLDTGAVRSLLADLTPSTDEPAP